MLVGDDKLVVNVTHFVIEEEACTGALATLRCHSVDSYRGEEKLFGNSLNLHGVPCLFWH